MPVIKNIDLNKKIDESLLNQVIIDDELARQLLLQDEKIETNHMLNFPEIQNKMRIMHNNSTERKYNHLEKEVENESVEVYNKSAM